MSAHSRRPRRLALALASVAGVAPLVACATPPEPAPPPPAAADDDELPYCRLCELYRVSERLVVRVQTESGLGAGVVVAADGTIVTNAHVVGAAEEVAIDTADGRRFGGRVLEVDADLDLALVRASPEAPPWHAATLETRPPRVGSEVFLIGHPFGLDWTVTRGVVSALRRRGGSTVIQTDAAVSPGTSGGAMLDESGRLVGIVTSKYIAPGAESLAFARTAADVLVLIERMRARAPGR